MGLNIWDNKGVSLEKQNKFTWKNIVEAPISKLDDDAWTAPTES